MEEVAISCTRVPTGYVVLMPSLNVRVEAHYLSFRGEPKGEVSTYLDDIPLTRAVMNLNSHTERKQYVTALRAERPEKDYLIDWRKVIEHSSAVVVDERRKGSPDVLVGDIPVPEAFTYRIDPLVVENEHNIIWADGGTGKSYFAMWLATLVEEGQNFADSSHGMAIEPGNVLYLDYETSPSSISKRFANIHRGLGIERKSKVAYRHMDRPIEEDLGALIEVCSRRNIDMVIIDSMSMGVGQQGLESSQSVVDYFRALSTLKCTTLTISHSNKQGYLFGSQFTHNQVRNEFEAVKEEGNTRTGAMELMMYHRKANDVQHVDPMTFSVEFDQNMVSYNRGEVISSKAASSISYYNLVLGVLKEYGPSDKDSVQKKILDLKNIKDISVNPNTEQSDKVRHELEEIRRAKNNISQAFTNLKNEEKIQSYESGDSKVGVLWKLFDQEGEEQKEQEPWTL